jgi:hypothetical protein
MIADHNLVKKSFGPMIADHDLVNDSNANDMRVIQNLNSFGEIIAHAQCSVDEKKYICIPYVPHKNN